MAGVSQKLNGRDLHPEVLTRIQYSLKWEEHPGKKRNLTTKANQGAASF